MNSLHQCVEQYQCFMSQPCIDDFVKRGGRVHVATEGQNQDVIRALYDAGHRDFAEKYVLQAKVKWQQLPDLIGAKVHFFGHLQRNKLTKAVAFFASIESVDRVTLIQALSRLQSHGLSLPPLMIQINLGHEPQKTGASVSELALLFELSQKLFLPVDGLMAIPPQSQNSTQFFVSLRRMADALDLQRCQMGMSRDYRQAIDAGSTDIRIGRAIFAKTAANQDQPAQCVL
jgi:PLP dependent protein